MSRCTRFFGGGGTVGAVLRLRDDDGVRVFSDEGWVSVARLERGATARGGTNAERMSRCARRRVSVDEDSPKVLNLPTGREAGVCTEAEATGPEREKLAALGGWDAVSATVGTTGAGGIGAGPVGAGPICVGPMGAKAICVKAIGAGPVVEGPGGGGPMGAKAICACGICEAPICAMLSAAIYKTVF